MASLSLRAYLQKIENLIDRGQTEEAIAHCKHILKKFPKHVDTYRLLGKSYLEMQRYQEASDVLQRVLSVIPDDFVSQIGMSIIREDSDNMDEAIWHMERAFEIQPSNNAVQEELKRLYGRRDGVVPQKILLTRGALVRMYVRGEAYPQAIAEGIAATKEDQQRPDIELLLAKSYLRTNQITEGYRICQNILESLPYSYEANQLIAEIHILTKQSEQAEPYLERIRMLDPYAAFVNENAPTSAKVDEDAIIIEEFEYDAMAIEAEINTSEENALYIDDDFDTSGLALATSQETSQPAPKEEDDLSWLSEKSEEFSSNQPTSDDISDIFEDKVESIENQNEEPVFNWEAEESVSVTESTNDLEDVPIASIENWTEQKEETTDADDAFAEIFSEMQTNDDLVNSENAPQIVNEDTPPAQEPITMAEFFKSSTPNGDQTDSEPTVVEPVIAESSVPESPISTAKSINDEDIVAGSSSEPDDTADADELPDWLKELDQETKQSDIEVDLQNEIDSLFTNGGLAEKGDSVKSSSIPDTNLDDEEEFAAKFLEELENEPQHPGKTRMFSLTADLSKGDSGPLIAPTEEQAAENASDEEIPDWLKALDGQQNQTDPTATTVPAAAEEKIESVISDVPEVDDLPKSEIKKSSTLDSMTAAEEDQLREKYKQSSKSDKATQMLAEEDDGFAWLESLAAKQGVEEETLLSKEEDRPDTPPEWTSQETVSESQVEEPIKMPEHTAPLGSFDLDDDQTHAAAIIPPAEEESEKFPEHTAPLQGLDIDDEQSIDTDNVPHTFDDESVKMPQHTAPLQGLDIDDEQILEEEPLTVSMLEQELPEPNLSEETPSKLTDETQWVDEFDEIETQMSKETQMLSSLPEEINASFDEIIIKEQEKPPVIEPPQTPDEIPDWLIDLEQQTSVYAVPEKEEEIVAISEDIEVELPTWLADDEKDSTDVELSQVMSELLNDDADSNDGTEIPSPHTEQDQIDKHLEKIISSEESVSATAPEKEKAQTDEPIHEVESVLSEPQTEDDDKSLSFDIPSDFVEEILQEPEPTKPESFEIPDENLQIVEIQSLIAKKEIADALERIDQLIEKEQHLDQIITELNKAIVDNPLDPAIYIRIGDAYIRNNEIQKALDMYQEAENLLQK
ncbi:MAG: tetratricopeptide repeat protein [Anaerolineaceae bacterium]|nr:tetratricopeptide repeat protein [Anaerolineaceae bacterium]